MALGLVDTEGLEFDCFMTDVEDLNKRAFSGTTDVTKMSCYAYAFAAGNYLILDSGSALGYKNGPLLIGRKKLTDKEICSSRIAIPGKYTTANLLFSLAWPESLNKTEYLFSDIVDIVLEEKVDAGLIIHETRFTYHEKGLIKIADMGQYWEELTGLPIPLGLIAVSRRIPLDIAMKVNRVIRRSLEYAGKHGQDISSFIEMNAREMQRSVIDSHIKLYVNDFTHDLGSEGKKAISELFGRGQKQGVVPRLPDEIFLISRTGYNIRND